MKSSFALALLSAICAVEAATTVTCTAGCPSSPTVEDLVTRSDPPVPSCTDDNKLTVVYNSGVSAPPSMVTPGAPGSDDGQGAQPTPSGPDVVEGAAGKLVGGAGAAIAAAVVAVYMI